MGLITPNPTRRVSGAKLITPDQIWSGPNPILRIKPLFYLDYTNRDINAYSKNGSGVPATAGGNVDRDNGTIEVPDYATRILKSGDSGIQTVIADDTARFVSGYYNETGYHSGAGLLLERASTNMTEHDFLEHGGGGSVVTAGQPCPFGSDKGNSVLYGNADDTCQSKVFSVIDATDYYFSFYIKKGTKATLEVTLFELTNFQFVQIIENVLATASTDAYQKYEAVVTATRTSESAWLMFRDTQGDTGTVEICGCQVTELPHSSTIPSVDGAMTRNVEALSYSSKDNFGLSAGTIALAYRANELPSNQTDSYSNVCVFKSGIYKIYMRYQQTHETRFYCNATFDGGEAALNIDTTGWTDKNELHVIVLTYANEDKLRGYHNDDSVVASAGNYETIPTPGVNDDIELSSPNSNNNFKTIVAFNRQFNAAEAAELIRLMRL